MAVAAVAVEQSRKHQLGSLIVNGEQAAAAVLEHLSYRDRRPAFEHYARTPIALPGGPEGGAVVVMMGFVLEPYWVIA